MESRGLGFPAKGPSEARLSKLASFPAVGLGGFSARNCGLKGGSGVGMCRDAGEIIGEKASDAFKLFFVVFVFGKIRSP